MPKIYCAACVVDDVYGSIAALVRKNRPDWQAGKLNFIGGKLEPGETPEQAEARELGEEAGLKLKPEQLQKVLVLIGKDHAYEVHFFRAVVPLEVVESARTMTDERIEIVDFDDLNPKETVPNLAWMIPMMRSHPRDAAWWYVVHEGQSEAPGPIPGLPTE